MRRGEFFADRPVKLNPTISDGEILPSPGLLNSLTHDFMNALSISRFGHKEWDI